MQKSYFYMALSVTLFISSCQKQEDNTNNTVPPCDRVVVDVTTDINTPTVWEDCHTYIISVNQISVNSTLTIQPGAVVKLKDIAGDNAISVSNSGKIIAIGDPGKPSSLGEPGVAGRPIVFTSYKDDAYSGDNNGDGTASVPARGDWGGIILNSDSNVFKFCKFSYGGKGPDAGTGQPTLEFSSYYGIIDKCAFTYCGGETTYNGYGVVDARSCHNQHFSITDSYFYGCIKPLFLNPFISIDNSNTFHNPYKNC